MARSKCRNWMGYFSEDHDVISIHVNSRHGIFGYGTDLNSISTNNGFADQQMALEWIYDNLPAMGGNPEKVAFVGQGLGGAGALLHAKRFKPNRVISTSASLNMKFPFSKNPEVAAENILTKLNCPTLTFFDCLSELTTEQVVSASQNVGQFPYGLVVDGELITDLNMDDLANVDLMIGMNTGDSFGWANTQYNRYIP